MNQDLKFFYGGAGIGLAGGVAGNIFVTALYRDLDGVATGHNETTALVGALGFLVIFGIIFWLLNRTD